jgi:hypothetical protein
LPVSSELPLKQTWSVVHTTRLGVIDSIVFVHRPTSCSAGARTLIPTGYTSTPWLSVTALYGASSAGVPRGAWTVTQRCQGSSESVWSHQLASPREVVRQ